MCNAPCCGPAQISMGQVCAANDVVEKQCACSMAKLHLRCCTSKNPTSRTYLSGAPTYSFFVKGAASLMKKLRKATGLDIVQTPGPPHLLAGQTLHIC